MSPGSDPIFYLGLAVDILVSKSSMRANETASAFQAQPVLLSGSRSASLISSDHFSTFSIILHHCITANKAGSSATP